MFIRCKDTQIMCNIQAFMALFAFMMIVQVKKVEEQSPRPYMPYSHEPDTLKLIYEY